MPPPRPTISAAIAHRCARRMRIVIAALGAGPRSGSPVLTWCSVELAGRAAAVAVVGGVAVVALLAGVGVRDAVATHRCRAVEVAGRRLATAVARLARLGVDGPVAA